MTAELPINDIAPGTWRPNRGRSRTIELIIKVICGGFAAISILTTIGIIGTLIFETIAFFRDLALGFSLGGVEFVDTVPREDLAPGHNVSIMNYVQAINHFFTAGRWTPLFASKQFGIGVLISATLMITFISLAVALPLGLLAAICLSEYASAKVRRILKPILEILAGVPTVVYGYFALLTVTPFLQSFLPPLEGFNALSAGIVLGVMITPMVASLSEDAIYSVPQSLRDGAYALGTTKRETVWSVVLPAALSGIVSSLILAMSRAVGETMIVTLAAGANPTLGFNPFVPVMTMTAFIVQVTAGDAPYGTIAYKTLFVVGMALFLITLALNVFSFWFVRRFRQKYD